MNQLRKFFRLGPTERIFLLEAVTLLAAVRIALWMLPLKQLQRISAKYPRSHSCFHERIQFSKERGVWAIQVASRYVPHTTCLTKALAAQALLRFDGIPAVVRIGVAKQTAENLEAHAWLESDGKILLGGAEADQEYKQLLSFVVEEP